MTTIFSNEGRRRSCISCFSPESKINVSVLAGLLAFPASEHPSRLCASRQWIHWFKSWPFGIGITATGIAPDLHRTSLFITFCVNQYAAKIGV